LASDTAEVPIVASASTAAIEVSDVSRSFGEKLLH
jgi:hypothetical protein